MDAILGISASLGLTLALGGMVFFAAIVAPTVFQALPANEAGSFLRRLFPRYYLFLIITTGTSALGYAFLAPTAAIVCALVAVSTLWVRQALVPRINRLRDAQLEGDAMAGVAFDRAHRLSVIINTTQLLGLGYIALVM